MRHRFPRAVEILLGIVGLATLILLAYWQVGTFGFVDYDDGGYAAQNAVVRRGLTWEGIAWAFTTLSLGNWHPLTWLSLMADVSVFGADAGWLHRTNVLWHLLDAVLIWFVLERLTGARLRSWLVAALFAVHPLHVESVAWISERKDLLCAFFWFLTIAAWHSYVRRPSIIRYVAALATFALGLLSKPMAVTLPVVLLLLDVWPLGRLSKGPDLGRQLRRSLLEKAPLLAMAMASSVVTIVAQHRGGATATTEAVPIAARAGNALLAGAWYLQKMVWPSDLAVFYPNPASGPAGLPAGRVGVSILLLLVLAAVVIWQRERRPFLLVGLLWFAVTLIPVIGLLQVGRQGMADRYTYIPLTGIFTALIWLVPEAWGATRARRVALVACCASVLLALSLAARAQTNHWRDSFSLFQHAANVVEDNWLAWKNLGAIHHQRGETGLALEAFRRSVQARPDEHDSWYDLGVEYAALDQHAVAAECFRRSVLIEPGDEGAWFALGISRAMLSQPDGVDEALQRLSVTNPGKARELKEIVERIARQLAGR